ncbi:hypothetical protein Y1Q_0017729 [Alligator mississippiensis]|uniref:Uncharacterized protein n=1 Tax=Alligator mississippiensis TaxID=8496 RepID=A0A151LYF0_ALLMI|nr:hypothetical protein Y1Q_0017729 [Alligator mississippiensis]
MLAAAPCPVTHSTRQHGKAQALGLGRFLASLRPGITVCTGAAKPCPAPPGINPERSTEMGRVGHRSGWAP